MDRIVARRVLRPDATLRPGAVVLDGERVGRVEELGPTDAAPDLTLAPGLVDLQVNGYAHLDVATGDRSSLRELGELLAARGTTTWCPTLTSRPLAEYRAWFDAHPQRAPGEHGLHLEGPFLSRPGAHRPGTALDPDPDWLGGLPERVRLVTLAPELPGATGAIAALRGSGRVVALGHSDATYEQALDAADAGATVVTHVFNAMGPLLHRAPGLVGAALTDDRLVPTVIGDGVHVHPAVLHLVLTGRRAALVSDSVAWLGANGDGRSGDGRSGDGRSGAAVHVAGGAARRGGGALAGGVLTLAEAVRVAVQRGHVPLDVVLRAATATPAAILGASDRGVLAPGARADLVAFDADLRVRAVWAGGALVGRR